VVREIRHVLARHRRVDDADRRLQMSLSRRVLIWNEGRPPDFESFGKPRPPLFDFRLERAALLLQGYEGLRGAKRH
jgi:hypothetical protein